MYLTSLVVSLSNSHHAHPFILEHAVPKDSENYRHPGHDGKFLNSSGLKLSSSKCTDKMQLVTCQYKGKTMTHCIVQNEPSNYRKSVPWNSPFDVLHAARQMGNPAEPFNGACHRHEINPGSNRHPMICCPYKHSPFLRVCRPFEFAERHVIPRNDAP